MMVRAMYAAGIVAIWILAWGSLTVANVLSGLLVAALLMVVTPGGIGGGRRPPVRPVAVARFIGYTIAGMVALERLARPRRPATSARPVPGGDGRSVADDARTACSR